MKKNRKKIIRTDDQEQTSPFLNKACKILAAYARTTGTIASVLDSGYQTVPESFVEIGPEKLTCLFCMKYKARDKANKFQEDPGHPCSEMHINAIKESQRYGGSFIYMCDLGFVFWTSPLFSEDTFAGALVGSGFLGIDSRETVAQMYLLGCGAIAEPELQKKITAFPRGSTEKIRALAELLLICAESLSTGKGEYHHILRRRAEHQESISLKLVELKNTCTPENPGTGYPLDKERSLLSCVQRGDIESCKLILDDLLAVLLFMNPGQYKDLQYRAIELVVLLSRTAIGPGANTQELLEINDNFLSLIQTAKTAEDIAIILHNAIKYYTDSIVSFQGMRHASAIKKAEWFIRKNFTGKISLQDIADASGFSASYFSTFFKEEMGENLSSYLNRLRVEKASELLAASGLSLGEIAASCGFEDQSWFSKTFKLYTGMSPGRYRNRSQSPNSENATVVFSKDYQSAIGENEAQNRKT